MLSFAVRRASSSSTSTALAAATTSMFKTSMSSGGVAVVRFDEPNSSVNKLSQQAMNEFKSVLSALRSESSVRAVVLASGKKDCFVAGADIGMLDAAKSSEEAQRMSSEGQKVMDELAAFPKPVVAAIHGTCMGGGLELAMACHYRIASTGAKTVMSLPEVQLGLLPGAGGTKRLPRLVGLQKALDLMTTGKNVKPEQARRMGLVNSVADPFALDAAAEAAARGLADGTLRAERPQKPLLQRLLEDSAPGRALVMRKAGEMIDAATGGKYPAPRAILRAVEGGAAAEAAEFGRLVMSPESAALRSIFFGTTALKKNRFGAPERKVETLAVLGAGLMGAGIAQVSVEKGMRVLLKDRDQKGLQRGLKQIGDNLDTKVKRKSLTQFDRERTASGVVGLTDADERWGQHMAQADLVVEAVFEDMKVKHDVIRNIERFLQPHAIFATNTSALPIGEVSKASKRPERVIGMHYFSPVDKMMLLEVIPHAGTDPKVSAAAVDVGLRQGKTVIVVKDVPGFYVNRSLGPFMAESMALLQDGVDPVKLDSALKSFGFPVGPVTLADEVGIDVANHVATFLSGALGQRMLGPNPAFLTEMVSRGLLGRKSGKGFFSYPPAAPGQKPAKASREVCPETKELIDKFRAGRQQSGAALSTEDVQLRMAGRFINEAAMCLQDGIIENPVDGDIGAVFGIGFPPFTGGPFRFLDRFGVDKFVAKMQGYAAASGPQFAPAQILVDYAKAGKKFHSK